MRYSSINYDLDSEDIAAIRDRQNTQPEMWNIIDENQTWAQFTRENTDQMADDDPSVSTEGCTI